MRALQRGLAILVVSLFVVSLFPAPAVANPVVPYCNVGIPSSAVNNQAVAQACMQTTGRVFPEALAHPDYVTGPNGFTTPPNAAGAPGAIPVTDYVGYFEFQAGMEYLAGMFPDWVEVHQVATSAGYPNIIGGPSSVPIYVLEISNEQSPIPRDQKLNLLFMLSIHGNEKGGREGGFRVYEDLLRDIGFATETVQNGAGMAQPLQKPTGGTVSTYRDYLDFMNIFLLFPNSDGWVCDEIEYQPSACQGAFTRGNAHGTDLNRQTPTIGWHNPNRNVLGEPESGGVGTQFPGFANWLVNQRNDSNGTFQWNYAIDIHGMLMHKNFGAIMLPAGSMTPQEMHRSLRLAETLKERWNADQHFAAWRTVFQGAETTWAAAGDLCGQVDCPAAGSALSGSPPSEALGSSQFAEYYTVIDAIGYTDSGFNGDFFAQTTGLNAPGYDIELAYNHIVTGSQYEGAGAQFNDYHVWMVRHIVKTFMDAAALDVQISFETDGLRTAYVPSQFVVTNMDDVDAEGNPRLTPGGWADENPGDDQWDYGPDQPFYARSARYWEDIKPFVCEECGTNSAEPGVLEARDLSALTAANLANFDNLIISGSAINQFFRTGTPSENSLPTVGDDGELGEVNNAKVTMVMDWVRAGGNLILTDAGLKFFDLAGLTKNGVQREFGYMGGIRMDLDHELLNKIRGGVKQTYEPTPLGFGVTGSAPNWGITPAEFNKLNGAENAGLVCPGSGLGQNCAGKNIALGQVPVGSGMIKFMGAVLPDPTEEFYHPYGLDDYATTYSANQIVRNMLGWDEVFASPPISIAGGKIVQSANERMAPDTSTDGGGKAGGADAKDTPALGLPAALALLGVAALARRRW